MSNDAFETTVQIRRNDFDASGHLYHGEYLTLIDEARGRFLMGPIINAPHSSYVVARIEIDYLSMILLKSRQVSVRIETGPRLGTSSFELIETVFAGDTVHARTRTVAVMWDTKRGCSRPMSELERMELTKHRHME